MPSMNVKILQVVKTTAQWAQVSDVISKGLLCVELDANNKSWIKIGDGVNTYTNLPYVTDGAIASLGTLFRIKGVKATTSELPESGNQTGDVWFVGSASTAGADKFEEYIWTTNSTWEFLGKISDPVIPVYTGGTGITIDNNDAINLDIATDSSLGGIKVGSNLTINSTTGVLDATDTTYEFADNYNASTNKGATVATVTNAINALDGGTIGTGGTGKTITSLSQTNGNVSATFEDISIDESQVSGVVKDVKIGDTSVVSNKVATLGAAAGKDVTDNSTATAVTSSDTNLITGRTLYNAGYIKDVSINGTTGTSFTGVAKSASVNGGAAVAADSSTGNIALTGIVTGMSYTDTSGQTATLSPTNGNLDVTSLILNCSL